MPYTKEEKKEYNRIYNLKNKEKNKEKGKAYYLKNKEKIKEYNKEYDKAYYLKNKEEIKEHKKEYRQTPAGIKSRRIYRWKNSGVICDDWDLLYDTYLNSKCCENCDIELTTDKTITPTTKCLDHDHLTGEFRNILCNSCNVKRG
tara:strand:+ start:184 stop:618 length:435 start_codon:yes stop_codon:yes gene_type:complete